MIIWISLGGRKKTSHWPAIYTVNLTLVITAYQTNCGTKSGTSSIVRNVQPPGPGFSWCGVDPGPCISKDYYCDQRFNCKTQAGEQKSHDEVSCQYDNKTDLKDDILEHDKEIEDDDDIMVDPNSLNTISWILIAV